MTSLLKPGSAGAEERALDLASQQRELRQLSDAIAEPPPGTLDDEGALDLRRYLAILLRRKWTLVIAVAVAWAAGLVVTYNTTPIYRSSVTVQIEPPRFQMTGLETEASMGLSYLFAANYRQTQLELLKSRALARRVIDKLGLEAPSKQPAEPATSFLAELKNTLNTWISGASEEDKGDKSTRKETKPNLEGRLVANTSVESSPDSNIVRIGYSSHNPPEAAAVANAIAQNFVDMNMQRRYDAITYAEDFLKERIEQVRANLEDSERRLVAYAKEREIVDFEDKRSTLMDTLHSLSEKLTEAESERIKAESEYNQSLEGTGSSTMKVMDSEVIQKLKQRKAELELEYRGQPKIYKPDYPTLVQLRQQIAEVDQQIKAEVAAISRAFKAEREAKALEQAKLQTRVSELKSEILALDDRSTDYQVLKREVDTNRELYNGLLQRMKEVGVVSGITANNISIVDRALVPGAPYIPNLKKNMTKALGIGLIGGILLVFLFEKLDDTIKTNEDVERRVRAPVLGVIPLVASQDYDTSEEQVALLAARQPKSPLAEASRSLLTSLSFSTAEGAPKIMHVTSPGPGDGKTMVATNVAIAFARTSGRVLMVDADLRNPSLHRLFGLSNTMGLTNYLASDTKPGHITQPTEVDGLFTITSGPLPPNPVELLASAKMLDLLSLVAERFDYVILDGPPVIGLADAIVLSKLSHGTVFVVYAGRTRYGEMEGSVKRLHDANAHLIGAVVDGYEHTGKRYGYGYGYSYKYQYSYDYGVGSQTATLPEKA